MIDNKHINKIIILLVIFALIFTFVFSLKPDLIGIKSSENKPEYAKKTLFDKEKISTINIIVDPDKWQEMLKNATSEEYILCDITINGDTFQAVGIRPKGNSSLNTIAKSDSDRYSFKIKMDKYVKDQSYFGLGKFVINNMIGDATYMKEYLSYELFSYLEVNTPLYAFSEIFINGEYWGLYLTVESIEEEYLQRNFGLDYGNLYKPETSNIEENKGNQFENRINFQFEEMMPPDNNQMNIEKMPTDPENIEENKGNQFENRMNFHFGEMMPPDNNQMNTEKMPTDPENIERHNNIKDRMNFQKENPATKSFESNLNNQFPTNHFNKESINGGADLIYLDDNIESYPQIFDQAVTKVSDKDKKKIIEVLKALSNNESEENIKKYINVEQVLSYFAANTYLVNLDSYVGNFKHNYYLYEKNGKVSILPWDLNLSFAGFQSGNATSAVNFPIDTPVAGGISLEDRPLISTLLKNEKFVETYYDKLQKIVVEYFENGLFNESINKIDELISQSVKNDPTKFYSYQEYKLAIETLKKYGDLRTKSIRGQLEGSVPSTSEEQSKDPKALIEASTINISLLGTMGGEKIRN
jgi:spore coat protein CotH